MTMKSVCFLFGVLCITLTDSKQTVAEVNGVEGFSHRTLGNQLYYSDERLKTNVRTANTTTLLNWIRNLQLKEFDFKYEQFYNPVFGKKQLGFIAQELAKVNPSAVGIVQKRKLDQNTVLENLHVINQDALYVANIGATQELGQHQEDLENRFNLFDSKIMQQLEDEISKRAEAVRQLETDQIELKALLKAAQSSSETVAQDFTRSKTVQEEVLKSLKEQSKVLENNLDEVEKAQLKKMESLKHVLNEQVMLAKKEVDLQVEKSLAAAREAMDKFQGTEKQVGEIAKESAKFKETSTSLLEKMSSQSETIAEILKKIMENKQSSTNLQRDLDLFQKENVKSHHDLEKAVQELKTSVAIEVEARKTAVTNLENKLQTYFSEQIKQYKIELTSIDTSFQESVTSVKNELKELGEAVHKQAGQELIEKRKLAEAEARIEESKIEQEKVRANEERKTSEHRLELELKQQDAMANSSRLRMEEEQRLREDAELRILSAKQNSTIELKLKESEIEQNMLKAKSDIELKKIEAERETVLKQAQLEAEMETIRERENYDIRANMSVLEAEQNRISSIATIEAMAEEARKTVQLASQNPVKIGYALSAIILTAFGIFSSREIALFIRNQIESMFGKPSLIRETSRNSSKLVSFMKRILLSLGLNYDDSDLELRKKSLKDALSDVILRKELKGQIERIASSTRSAYSRGTPLRHILLHGPPGTGKTMVAKRIALWCGLEYAIMSGADIAPLKEQAVSELHNLFKWAKTTKRGVLLFIDEADAFLGSRHSKNQSEGMRNSLTALLYHTGSHSAKLMLVLATNRPMDLDSAVLDRIDEAVEFSTPPLIERTLILKQYYQQNIAEFCNCASEDMLSEAAESMEGLSGRQISKMMVTLQSHLYAAGEISEQVAEVPSIFQKFNDMINKKSYKAEQKSFSRQKSTKQARKIFFDVVNNAIRQQRNMKDSLSPIRALRLPAFMDKDILIEEKEKGNNQQES